VKHAICINSVTWLSLFEHTARKIALGCSSQVAYRLRGENCDSERFCYHRAAAMKPALVKKWLTHIRAKALARARSELLPLMQRVGVGAIVAAAVSHP
jgi:hypothetical protein